MACQSAPPHRPAMTEYPGVPSDAMARCQPPVEPTMEPEGRERGAVLRRWRRRCPARSRACGKSKRCVLQSSAAGGKGP